MSYLRHHHVLTLANVRVLRLDNCLKELEVLHVSTMSLDAADEMLHDAFGYFAAQRSVVMKQHAQRLRFQQLPLHNNISHLLTTLQLHTKFTD